MGVPFFEAVATQDVWFRSLEQVRVLGVYLRDFATCDMETSSDKGPPDMPEHSVRTPDFRRNLYPKGPRTQIVGF